MQDPTLNFSPHIPPHATKRRFFNAILQYVNDITKLLLFSSDGFPPVCPNTRKNTLERSAAQNIFFFTFYRSHFFRVCFRFRKVFRQNMADTLHGLKDPFVIFFLLWEGLMCGLYGGFVYFPSDDQGDVLDSFVWFQVRIKKHTGNCGLWVFACEKSHLFSFALLFGCFRIWGIFPSHKNGGKWGRRETRDFLFFSENCAVKRALVFREFSWKWNFPASCESKYTRTRALAKQSRIFFSFRILRTLFSFVGFWVKMGFFSPPFLGGWVPSFTLDHKFSVCDFHGFLWCLLL